MRHCGLRKGFARGITLVEVLVAIAITSVVVTLLAFPLLSAFGYLKKATARSEAQRAALQAMRKLSVEYANATYPFDPPVDGSWLAFVQEPTRTGSVDIIGAMSYNNGNPQVRFIRYGQMLDFPWTPAQGTAEAWTLLQPGYTKRTAGVDPRETYPAVYAPYHGPQGNGGMNPYVLARYERADMPWATLREVRSSVDTWAYGTIANAPLDGSDYAALRNSVENRSLLQRRVRNDLVSLTPYGDTWDVPRFEAQPLRQRAEALRRLSDGEGQTQQTVLVGRYPLWVARNRDLDDVLLKSNVSINAVYGRASADVRSYVNSLTPLYPVGVNPYGFQARVFDGNGQRVYGTNYAGGTYDLRYDRHFMDWPAIDRPDMAAWSDTERDDYRRAVDGQRYEGKLVFAQPMRTTELVVAGEATILPIPAGQWSNARTYCVQMPHRLTLRNGAGQRYPYRQVAPTAALTAGTYRMPNAGKYYDPSDPTVELRRVEFGPLPKKRALDPDVTLPDATYDVFSGATTEQRLSYSICDLQPDDTVVATYSTKAVLDITLVVSRQDSAGRTPAQRRQDFTTKTRIEARNAQQRARGH